MVPLLLLAASCESWLDVQPKTEIKESTMFETEQGFKDALIGCYELLSERDAYGAEMTCTFMEVLARQYYLGEYVSGTYYNAYRYIYTGTTSTVDGIWAKLYTVIANVNAMTEALERNRDMLAPVSYSLLKAEACGLRAFIYFDLVRLFTWGNLPERPEVLNEPSIPYTKVYSKHLVPQEKLGFVLREIHRDLETAIDLFLDYDPDSKKGSRPDDYTTPSNEDQFWSASQRKYRMNLRAAMATRMRLNLWEGNYQEAYEDTQTLQSNDYPLQWITAGGLTTDDKSKDLTFAKEMIFGVQTYERYEKVWKTYFKRLAADDLNSNSNFMSMKKEDGEERYEVESGLGVADYRYTYWWGEKTHDDGTWCFNKFAEVENMTTANNMPLIKSSEICYTEAECLLRMGGEANKVKAVEALNRVRNNRGLSSSPLATSLSASEVWDELEKEWRKESVGEGQLFFYYKRQNLQIPGASNAPDDKMFVLPLPQNEVDLGGSVDLIERN